MNLTFEDNYSRRYRGNADTASHCHACVAAGVAAANKNGVDLSAPGQLSGFFSSLVNFVKTTNSAPLKAVQQLVTHGPAAALAQTKADVASGAHSVAGVASVIAPVASIFGPVGSIISSGVKLIQVADSKRIASAANAVASNVGSSNAALIQAYAPLAGSVPGRVFGLDNMRKVMNAAFGEGAIPAPMIDTKGTRKIWSNMAADFVDSAGGRCATSKYACSDGILTLAQKNPNLSAAQLAGLYIQTNPNGGPLNADIQQSGLEGQIFVDTADAALAQVNPNSPLTYGVTNADLPAPVAPPSAVVSAPALPAGGTFAATDASGRPLLIGPSQPVAPIVASVASPTPTFTPAPAAQALTQAGVSPATSDQINQMLAAMQQQGANQQQMINAAMQQLQNSGVNTSVPAVQTAAAADVAQMQTAGVSTAGISSLPGWLLPVLAGGAVLFALARPKSFGGKRSRAFDRKKNPRRRRRR